MSVTSQPSSLPIHCFSLEATAEPGVMPRVMALFAKRGLVPTAWHSRVGSGTRPAVHIDIEMAGLERANADYMAQCMRQIVGVGLVLTSQKAAASAGMGVRAAS